MAGLQADWDFLSDFKQRGTLAVDALRAQAGQSPWGWPAFWMSHVCAPWRRCIFQTKSLTGNDALISIPLSSFLRKQESRGPGTGPRFRGVTDTALVLQGIIFGHTPGLGDAYFQGRFPVMQIFWTSTPSGLGMVGRPLPKHPVMTRMRRFRTSHPHPGTGRFDP